MSKVTFVLNYDGVSELLHSSAMKGVLSEYGNLVKGNATTRQKAVKEKQEDGTMKTVGTEEVKRSNGASYKVEIKDKGSRAIAIVATDGNYAYNSELKHNNLLKGLSASRKAGKQ